MANRRRLMLVVSVSTVLFVSLMSGRFAGQVPRAESEAISVVDEGTSKQTPWGKPALGKRTRRNKSTNKFILRRRYDR